MRKLLLLTFLIAMSLCCNAQDIIVTNSGERIECIIKSESDVAINYTEWKDKKSVLKSIPMSSVWSVTYDEKLKRDNSVSSLSTYKPYTNKSQVTMSAMTGVTPGSSSSMKYKKPKSGVGGFILGFCGYLVFFTGGLSGGALLIADDNPWGYVVLGVGVAGGITCLTLGLKSLKKPASRYSCIMDVPVNDKFSVGLYDYAFAPTQRHGTGLGVKFRF